MKMAERTLREQLDTLRQGYQTRIEEIECEQERCRAEQAETQSEIRQLLERHWELGETLPRLKAEKGRQADKFAQRGFEAVRAALGKSYDNLRQTQNHWVTWHHFYAERRDLLEKDPELKTILQDYRQLDAELPEILGRLPPSYHAPLLAEHKQFQERLAPYLALLDQAQQQSCSHPITLEVVLSHNPEAGEMRWAFPCREDPALPEEIDDALYDVTGAVIYAITRFKTQPDWFFDEAEQDEWAGYEALVTAGEHTGEQNLADVAQTLLQATLAEMSLFRDTALTVRVTEVPQAVWELGQAWQEAETTPTAAPPEVEAVGLALVEVTGGWYRDADIETWERPLNVASDSLWNVQARRLRTLLIRMVAKGKVGAQAIPEDLLWQHLPPPHGDQLACGVKHLVDEGLLLQKTPADGNGHQVTLNPEMLPEVQSLINYDVTPFWAGLIRAEENDV
jgi:5-methylcytosine-specific restriction endonuclease McrA